MLNLNAKLKERYEKFDIKLMNTFHSCYRSMQMKERLANLMSNNPFVGSDDTASSPTKSRFNWASMFLPSSPGESRTADRPQSEAEREAYRARARAKALSHPRALNGVLYRAEAKQSVLFNMYVEDYADRELKDGIEDVVTNP